MSAFEAIVLGIVQGLTEFLPISSTAHLRIVPAFLGWEDPGAAFTAVVPARDDGRRPALLPRRTCGGSRAPGCRAAPARRSAATLDARMGWYIIIGTIPIGDLRPDLQGPDRERRPRPLR